MMSAESIDMPSLEEDLAYDLCWVCLEHREGMYHKNCYGFLCLCCLESARIIFRCPNCREVAFYDELTVCVRNRSGRTKNRFRLNFKAGFGSYTVSHIIRVIYEELGLPMDEDAHCEVSFFEITSGGWCRSSLPISVAKDAPLSQKFRLSIYL